MKLSARNLLKGAVVAVVNGQTTAHERLDVNGTIVTSSNTDEAVNDLGLTGGMTDDALLKSFDVMIAID